MMERPRHPRMCTTVLALRVALEQVNNTDPVAMPAWLARKLVHEHDAYTRARFPAWAAVAIIFALLTSATAQCAMAPAARHPAHERAHTGEQP